MTLDGKTRELFRSDTNIGYPRLSISPDGGLAAVFTGGSGGGGACLNDSQVAIGTMNTGPNKRPAGLPPIPADGSRTEYGDLSWTATGDLLLALREVVITTPGVIPAQCRSQEQPLQLYRCPAGRDCAPLPLTPRAAREVRPALDVHSGPGQGFSGVRQASDGTLAIDQHAVTFHNTGQLLVVPVNGPATTLAGAGGPAWSN